MAHVTIGGVTFEKDEIVPLYRFVNSLGGYHAFSNHNPIYLTGMFISMMTRDCGWVPGNYIFEPWSGKDAGRTR